MAKHTPGPWEIRPLNKYAGNMIAKGTEAIAEVFGGNETRQANARLIATAPELLGACKEALIDLEFLKDYIPRDSNSIKRLKQVIAKAEQERHLE